MDALFSPENFSAREQVTEWVKLKEKLGTRVGGYFLGFWEKPAEGVYKRQISMALKDFKNPGVVYGITLPDYFEKDLCQFRLNDRVGAEYYKDIPAKGPGLSATKAVRLVNQDLKMRMGTTAAPSATPKVGANDVATIEMGEDDDNDF